MPASRGSKADRRRTWAVSDVPDAPVDGVAVRTLRRRLEAVWSELAAACAHGHDSERVHQLRVATRRTIAALDAFRSLLPRKSREWFCRQLRRIRRAAGEARDLDVLTERLSHRAAGASAAGRDARRRLVAMLSRQRAESRRPIHEVRERLLLADWPARVERLLDAVASRRDRRTFGRYARRRLKPLMRRFFGRADRRLRDDEEIHRLRIEGKKLRYALEIFATAFPERVRAKCERALESLQESLGEFTDHAAAADRLGRWSRKRGVGAERTTLASLRERESTEANEARKVFVRWWNPSRRRWLRRRFEQTLRRGSA